MRGKTMRFLKLGRNMLSACFIASTSFAAGGGGYIEDFDFSFEGPLASYYYKDIVKPVGIKARSA